MFLYCRICQCNSYNNTTGSTSRTAYVANDIVHCIDTHPLITHAGIHITCMRTYTPMHMHTCMLHSVDLSVNVYIRAYICMGGASQCKLNMTDKVKV